MNKPESIHLVNRLMKDYIENQKKITDLLCNEIRETKSRLDRLEDSMMKK